MKYFPKLSPNVTKAIIAQAHENVLSNKWPFLLEPLMLILSLKNPYIILNDHGTATIPMKNWTSAGSSESQSLYSERRHKSKNYLKPWMKLQIISTTMKDLSKFLQIFPIPPSSSSFVCWDISSSPTLLVGEALSSLLKVFDFVMTAFPFQLLFSSSISQSL
jgi:hypothetical protein